MTTRRAIKTRWNHRPGPAPAPESDAMKRARRLPLPGPGIVILVKLDILPEYLELHRLTPLPRESAIGERPDPILKVERTKKDGNR